MFKKFIFFISIFFLFNMSLYAACTEKALLNEADEVKLNANVFETPEFLYFIIKIDNIKENMAVVVTEDYNDTKTTYKYKNTKDGILELKEPNIYDIVNYTIKIYSLDSACQNMLLSTKKISTLKYNEYASYEICKGNEHFDMCRPFYKGEIASKEIFNNALKEYQKKQEETTFDKIWNVIKEYYLYVLIPIILISGGYAVVMIYKDWRRKRK